MARFCILVTMLSAGCSLMPHVSRQDQRDRRDDVQLASYEVAAEPAATKTVYVTSNGFHTGLVVRRADVSPEHWPEIENGSNLPWVEVGWGSEAFYRARLITPLIIAKAVVPNVSVLHVVNWPVTPDEIFMGRVVKLEVDAERFDAMCRFIHGTYDLRTGAAEFLGPGIYGESAFYRARSPYYFPNTCNIWTARALQHAGVPVIPELCSTAQAVMFAAGQSGAPVGQ